MKVGAGFEKSLCVGQYKSICISHFVSIIVDFTRLKLVQGKKEAERLREAAQKAAEAAHDAEFQTQTKQPQAKKKHNDEDITAAFDANDDADVVF